MRALKLFVAFLFLAPVFMQSYSLGSEKSPVFVNLAEAVAGIECAARYAGSDNFAGRPLDGYERPVCLGTPELAQGLSRVQQALQPAGLSLIIFDAYRPQRAVNDLVAWTQDAPDQKNKAAYYPGVAKSDLIPNGYIAARSGHSRGSTVDLSVLDIETGSELDMGTGFDVFSPQSGDGAVGLTREQRTNRLLLKTLMVQAGFAPYSAEWWHFTLIDEPWPDTYFDLPVR